MCKYKINITVIDVHIHIYVCETEINNESNTIRMVSILHVG